MAYFEGRDLEVIQSLVYDPSARPRFEAIKSCLIWPDEGPPPGLSRDGRDKLVDLWVARSYLHLGRPLDSHPISPTRLPEAWSAARAQGFRWPGFQRLVLSPEDRAYLNACLGQMASGEPL